MSIEEFKVIFWWEWAHRFLGRLIGITFLIPLIYFSIKIKMLKILNLYLIFFLICFQGFIGWYMVQSGLVNRIDVSHFRLSIHLLVAFIILSLIYWNFLKIRENRNNYLRLSSIIPFTFMILIFIQIVFGAFVSGMDAGKIYNSWPLMGDTYFPNDNNFRNLFKLSVFSDPSLVQFIHRNMAYLIGLFYLLIFYKVYSNKLFELYKSINILGLTIILQIILGIFTVIYGAQIYIASLHQISSIILVSSCVYFLHINTNFN
jgi:cytochrome c oxidase assembly protein subunit 15